MFVFPWLFLFLSSVSIIIQAAHVAPVEVALMGSLLVPGLQGRHHDAMMSPRAKKNGATICGGDVLERIM